MSNCKQVSIAGEMPFNVYEHAEALAWLGRLNAPSFGLRIGYGSSHYVPNDHGGQTAMYEFEIEGIEALAWGAIDDLVIALEQAGAVINSRYEHDIEAGL